MHRQNRNHSCSIEKIVWNFVEIFFNRIAQNKIVERRFWEHNSSPLIYSKITRVLMFLFNGSEIFPFFPFFLIRPLRDTDKIEVNSLNERVVRESSSSFIIKRNFETRIRWDASIFRVINFEHARRRSKIMREKKKKKKEKNKQFHFI